MQHEYEGYDPDYDHEDYEVTEMASEKRRARNAHMSLGFVFGIIATIASQYVVLWVLNIF